jgi:uncharacterized protein (TIGR03032 family)
VGRIQRRPNGKDQNDARRRLASAAARTARQAADIKYRKRNGGQRPSVLVSSTAQSSAEEEPVARYSMSDGLVSFLHDQNIAIAFTSFETGHLFLIGCTATDQLTVDARRFRKATGLHLAGGTLLMATLAHVYRMENILRPDQRLDGTFSHCYVPRTGHFTGVLDAHDVGMTNASEAVFIATRYNCLAATSATHSFKPLWKPPFISDIVAEDRCHLNGLAMRNGKPSHATAIGRSNEYDGWRDCVADGGIVMDVERNVVICEGLSMPHSPRVHEDKLWLLNSGAGELGYIDLGESAPVRFRSVSFCPGFVRGLALRGRYAFVGLSRPRYGDFDGLELDTRLREAGVEAQCGLQVIDTASGQCIHWLRIDGQVRELYDVAVLPEVRCPTSVGFHNDEALDMISIEDSR